MMGTNTDYVTEVFLKSW